MRALVLLALCLPLAFLPAASANTEGWPLDGYCQYTPDPLGYDASDGACVEGGYLVPCASVWDRDGNTKTTYYLGCAYIE